MLLTSTLTTFFITGIRMRQALALALALGAATLPALAEDFHGKGLRPFIGAGFTWGGDTITPVTLTPEGSTTTHYEEDISAGAGLALQFGLSYRLSTTPWTLQASFGYHNDQAHGLTGTFYFRRIPLELMAQWHATERMRVGFGVRRGVRAKFSLQGGTCTDNQGNSGVCAVNERMKGSTGVVLEVEQMLTPSWGVKARYVHEYYQFNDRTVDDHKYDGNHIGLMTTFYFN
jgi:outer membrane protein W